MPKNIVEVNYLYFFCKRDRRPRGTRETGQRMRGDPALPFRVAAMRKVCLLGGGKIGLLAAGLLVRSGDYRVVVGDRDDHALASLHHHFPSSDLTTVSLDAARGDALDRCLRAHEIDAVVSTLPYHHTGGVASAAHRLNVHYFDVTEDVAVTRHVRALAHGASAAFVPQCGLAPGFVSIVANHVMQRFQRIDTVKMRVGALPINPSHALKYSLTWSTDGLINEYGNPCQAIEGGRLVEPLPLEGYETITLDGVLYEAFNTSGGLGTLAESYQGRVQSMSYKTLRYPGHCEKIRLLMIDLKLNDDRPTLKRILENAVPQTVQDVVLIYVSVSGLRDGDLVEKSYVKKVYPAYLDGRRWSAVQITTAAGLCAVVDIVLQHPDTYHGFICQEAFSLAEILHNRFGRLYEETFRRSTDPQGDRLAGVD